MALHHYTYTLLVGSMAIASLVTDTSQHSHQACDQLHHSSVTFTLHDTISTAVQSHEAILIVKQKSEIHPVQLIGAETVHAVMFFNSRQE